MVKRPVMRKRLVVAAGSFAVLAALCPFTVMAQQAQTSGGVVLSGGVTSNPSTAGVQTGRPVVLPNTGGGPVESDPPLVPIVTALAGAAGGVYLLVRRRSQVRG